MTESDKLKDDLAYVRAAIDRQRRLACEVLPLWLAAVIGSAFVGLAFLKDLQTLGHVSETAMDVTVVAAAAVALGAVVFRKRHGLDRKESVQDLTSAFDTSQKRRMALQAATFIGGMIFLNHVLDQAGVPDRAADVIIFTYLAISMILMGLGGLHMLLWFGLGMAGGALAFWFLDIAFVKTTLGLCLAGGLIVGAWLDRQALARSEG